MNKKYVVTKTKNGFLIEMWHEVGSGLDSNKYVAQDLKSVVSIIENDLKKIK